jgi:hypothetical protein
MPKTAPTPPEKVVESPINKGFCRVANCVRNAVDALAVSLSVSITSKNPNLALVDLWVTQGSKQPLF